MLMMSIARLSQVVLLVGLFAISFPLRAQDSVPDSEPTRTKAEEKKAEREAKKKAAEDLKAAKSLATRRR